MGILQKFFGKNKTAKVQEDMPTMSVKGDKAFGSGSGSASRGSGGGGGKNSMHFHPEVSLVTWKDNSTLSIRDQECYLELLGSRCGQHYSESVAGSQDASLSLPTVSSLMISNSWNVKFMKNSRPRRK